MTSSLHGVNHHDRHPRLMRQAGFSLVEVLCALTILGVGLLGLTAGLTTALRSTKESELQAGAALFAAGVIETLRAEGYLTDGETEGECGDVLTGCQWRQVLSPTDLDGLHEVAVTIEHTESGKILCELRTLLFEAPLTSSDTSSSRDRSRRRDQERRR